MDAALVRRFVLNGSVEFTGPNDEAYDIALRLLREEPGLATASDHAALVLGDAARLRVVLERDPEWAHDASGPYTDRQPLHYVTHSRFWRRGGREAAGLLDCARLLLDAGADPNARYTSIDGGERRLSALLGACGAAHFPAMTRLLLERGANPDDNESLYHSLEFPTLECCRIILEHGARPAGTNALNHSLDFADSTATRLLLEHGADPNEQTEFNGAPLHWAVSRGRDATRLELLIERGADPRAVRRRDGRTPYAVALQTGHRDAAAYLASIGAATDVTPIDAFAAACAAGDPGGARALLDRHPALLEDLPDTDVEGFHLLAELGRAAALAAAIDAGLPPDLRNRRGQTPLHRACWHGRADVVEMLLERGAELDPVESEYGCTPLLWAAHGSTNWPAPDGDYPRVVRLLLAAGAAVRATNAWSETAVSLAGGADRIVGLLRAAGAPERGDPG